ncbi:TlpA family protein disulfide reductase, partial [bacterium]
MTIAILAALALHAAPVKAEYPPYTKKELYAKTDLRGKKAPKMVWGQTVAGTIPSLKGKVVLVDFWATWCPPCRETLPELSGFQKKFAKDLVVVGVSDEPKAKLTEFLAKTPVSYAITSDPA